MALCPDCHGTGVVLLFTSATPCESCGGTGKYQTECPRPAETASESSPSRQVVTGVGGDGNGGSITIYAGASTGAGAGGDITFTTGNSTASTLTFQDEYAHGGGVTMLNTSAANLTTNITMGDGDTTWLTSNAQGLHFGSANAPQVSMFTGTKAPTDSPPEASLGSLYFQDDGKSGTLWMKVSADSWSPLSVDQPTTTMADPDAAVTRALHEVVQDDEFGWVAELIARLEKADTTDDQLEELIGCSVPCMAPVSTAIVSDMMAMMEQAGHEVTAFVSSPRDFADVRKFERGDHVVWNGKSVTVFGIPFLRSREIPVGYMAAVCGSKKCVLATICR